MRPAGEAGGALGARLELPRAGRRRARGAGRGGGGGRGSGGDGGAGGEAVPGRVCQERPRLLQEVRREHRQGLAAPGAHGAGTAWRGRRGRGAGSCGRSARYRRRRGQPAAPLPPRCSEAARPRLSLLRGRAQPIFNRGSFARCRVRSSAGAAVPAALPAGGSRLPCSPGLQGQLEPEPCRVHRAGPGGRTEALCAVREARRAPRLGFPVPREAARCPGRGIPARCALCMRGRGTAARKP